MSCSKDDNIQSDNDAKFVWRPDSISYSIETDTLYLKIGKYLQLNQILKKNESGWTQLKIDIPENWEVDKINFNENELILYLENGIQYYLSPINVGELNFEILSNKNKNDSELTEIWNRFAKKVNTSNKMGN